MLGGILLFLFSLATISNADLCKPGAPGALKVRLNIKAALGEKAYKWNANEDFLFKSMIAFTLRSYTNNTSFQVSNVLLCNMTPRVSFWFVVTSPSNDSDPFPYSEVEAAIRQERNRINRAFLLDDKTLEFVQIPSTMIPNLRSSASSWLIVFGVIVGAIGISIVYLVVSGVTRYRKRMKSPQHQDKTADVIENGRHYEINIFKPASESDIYDNSVDTHTRF